MSEEKPTDTDREKIEQWIAELRARYSVDDLPSLTVDLLAELVAAGRSAERARCADIAESLGLESYCVSTCCAIAAAIRSGDSALRAGLTWTSEPPKGPGWYWFRESTTQKPWCCRVSVENGRMYAGDDAACFDLEVVTDCHPACQWSSAPILPPGDSTT